ncbi:ABC transporter permease subunit [uncultured Shewanella sp.]|uniref:ABC transporter permease subunit n=1 Tax=uncultured Shewanella sp. TaxID=173975 RepID=UPI00260A9097|nr:ABC transporter permease subunit [uncultured Shewanella sp.]
MKKNNLLFKDRLLNKNNYLLLNYKDFMLMLTIGLFGFLFYVGWQDMHNPLTALTQLNDISLSPEKLPYYSLRTTMRLIIGMVFSLLFAIIVGYASAKNKHIARITLPIINFLESAPLIGFLTFTTALFLFVFPKSIMGLEAAAIFGVFTSQAWNLALIFYQTLRIIPDDLIEVSQSFNLNAWQHLWRIELPYSIPGLLWNTMVSQSAAWFAIVATEALPLGNKTIMLPGIGSYIQTALVNSDIKAICLAIIAIIINITLFDQFLFRPLVKWSEKFKYEDITSTAPSTSWFYHLLTHSFIANKFNHYYKICIHSMINLPSYFVAKFKLSPLSLSSKIKQGSTGLWYLLFFAIFSYICYQLWLFFPNGSMLYLIPLMLKTTLRVAIAMLLSVILFTPIGIWIGLNPRLTRLFQPIIQVLAAIPPNVLFPVITIILVTTNQSLNLWAIPLIMLGTLWYVLFNVIAGAASLPQNMLEMAKSFRLNGWNWWFKFMIPAIFPYIVTGIISAAGGAWNSAIAAEFLQWGNQTITTDGIGALIAETTNNNQLHQAALAVSALCFLVSLCVIFIWRPLYRLAETRYKV